MGDFDYATILVSSPSLVLSSLNHHSSHLILPNHSHWPSPPGSPKSPDSLWSLPWSTSHPDAAGCGKCKVSKEHPCPHSYSPGCPGVLSPFPPSFSLVGSQPLPTLTAPRSCWSPPPSNKYPPQPCDKTHPFLYYTIQVPKDINVCLGKQAYILLWGSIAGSVKRSIAGSIAGAVA